MLDGDLFYLEHGNDIKLMQISNENEINFIKEEGYNPNNFYKIEGKLFKYAYINNTVFIEIYGDISKFNFQTQMIKDRIQQVEKAHKKCIENRDYERLFNLIDKPYRFDWFMKLYSDIPDKNKYNIFRNIYISSEYGFDEIPRDFLEDVFSYNVSINWLTEYEDEDIITIYRGEGCYSTCYRDAYSWTLDFKVAQFFATRFDDNGEIYKGKVKKKHILDYIESRNESEVLVYPENVFDVVSVED